MANWFTNTVNWFKPMVTGVVDQVNNFPPVAAIRYDVVGPTDQMRENAKLRSEYMETLRNQYFKAHAKATEADYQKWLNATAGNNAWRDFNFQPNVPPNPGKSPDPGGGGDNIIGIALLALMVGGVIAIIKR